MRKAKITGDVALLEVSKSTLGVLTRAKTLALRRLQLHSTTATPPPSAKPESCYLVLRSRRLEKPILLPGTKKQQTAKSKAGTDGVCRPNHVAELNSRPNASLFRSGSVDVVSIGCSDKGIGCEKETEATASQGETCCDCDLGVEASFGESNLDLEVRERNTRESTPCSLIRGPEMVGTPGSTTKQKWNVVANQSTGNALRTIPTTHEVEEFFAHAEQRQRRLFIEKYNFDIVNDLPLQGRYEWVRMHL